MRGRSEGTGGLGQVQSREEKSMRVFGPGVVYEDVPSNSHSAARNWGTHLDGTLTGAGRGSRGDRPVASLWCLPSWCMWVWCRRSTLDVTMPLNG